LERFLSYFITAVFYSIGVQDFCCGGALIGGALIGDALIGGAQIGGALIGVNS